MTKEEKDVVMGNTSDSETDKKQNDLKTNTAEILSDEDLKLKNELEQLAKICLVMIAQHISLH
ncbi:hypothetical protein ACO0SA_003242 [Hanseniaspora valbyensis]